MIKNLLKNYKLLVLLYLIIFFSLEFVGKSLCSNLVGLTLLGIIYLMLCFNVFFDKIKLNKIQMMCVILKTLVGFIMVFYLSYNIIINCFK